jgi:hypothetical protein
LASGPIIARFGCSSAPSLDKLDCYFILPPAPILEEMLPNWQECDEKPRNSRELGLIHQIAFQGLMHRYIRNFLLQHLLTFESCLRQRFREVVLRWNGVPDSSFRETTVMSAT